MYSFLSLYCPFFDICNNPEWEHRLIYFLRDLLFQAGSAVKSDHISQVFIWLCLHSHSFLPTQEIINKKSSKLASASKLCTLSFKSHLSEISSLYVVDSKNLQKAIFEVDFGNLCKLLKMGKCPDTLFQKSGAVERIISVVFGVKIYRRALRWLVVGNEQIMQSASVF